MQSANLEALPKKTLIRLVKMYSRNWQTLDGLWFGNVEATYGLDAAVHIDLQNWEKQAIIEATRIRDTLEIRGGGLTAVLTVLSFMSWQLTSPSFECETKNPTKVIIYYPHCAVQEGRAKLNKQVFPCKTMKLTLLSSIARVVEPEANVKCLSCPPDIRHLDYWCKWELSLNKT